MDAITQKHASLISGLHEIYALLAAMRYILPSDIVQPPHDANMIQNSTFLDLGYDIDTINVMRAIPALRTEVVWGWQKEGIELLPRSKLVNYFITPEDEWGQFLRWGDWSMMARGREEGEAVDSGHRLLPPWMLKLTIGGMYNGQYGVDLVYNVKNGEIIEWSRIGGKLWDESPNKPAEVVLSGIVSSFKNLAWVPHISSLDQVGDTPRMREILENPVLVGNMLPGFIRLSEDPAQAIQELDGPYQTQMRMRVNRWKAIQKLYRDCRWGTDGFDGEEFGRIRAEWLREEREGKQLARQSRVARLMANQWGFDISERNRKQNGQIAPDREWEMTFWTEKAGVDAV
ncbi:unnamed protein product [Periconia digitata]|uniref:Uncharacterized protein n=1 Tax=Periconia digitata TaxID=1303443 RepID=A0A9W4UIQ6_9PLEO|nr:unnamed protein product [Periconia digitata]